MSLPYYQEDWETAQYRAYVEQARRFKASGHHKKQMEMVRKAENLKSELISKQTASDKLIEDTYDDYVKDCGETGKIPLIYADYLDLGRDKAKDIAVAVSSPVLIAAVAGALLYFFVIKGK